MCLTRKDLDDVLDKFKQLCANGCTAVYAMATAFTWKHGHKDRKARVVSKSNENDSSLHLFVRSHLGRALGGIRAILVLLFGNSNDDGFDTLMVLAKAWTT